MSDQTQHKTLQTTIDKLSTDQESVANQTDQLQLLYAIIRNILSGERDFNEGYMFCNEVVCIRPLVLYCYLSLTIIFYDLHQNLAKTNNHRTRTVSILMSEHWRVLYDIPHGYYGYYS